MSNPHRVMAMLSTLALTGTLPADPDVPSDAGTLKIPNRTSIVEKSAVWGLGCGPVPRFSDKVHEAMRSYCAYHGGVFLLFYRKEHVILIPIKFCPFRSGCVSYPLPVTADPPIPAESIEWNGDKQTTTFRINTVPMLKGMVLRSFAGTIHLIDIAWKPSGVSKDCLYGLVEIPIWWWERGRIFTKVEIRFYEPVDLLCTYPEQKAQKIVPQFTPLPKPFEMEIAAPFSSISQLQLREIEGHVPVEVDLPSPTLAAHQSHDMYAPPPPLPSTMSVFLEEAGALERKRMRTEEM